jgi:hypothetical protein
MGLVISDFGLRISAFGFIALAQWEPSRNLIGEPMRDVTP